MADELYEKPTNIQRKPTKNNQTAPEINQIICGDALDTMRSWPDACVDHVITDPPYNIAKKSKGLKWAFSSHVTMQSDWDRFVDDDYESFTLAWIGEVCRVTKKNGNIFIFGSYHNIYAIGAMAARLGLRFINSIIWAKPNAQPNITCRMFTESTEQIIWLCNNDVKSASHWTFNYELVKQMNQGKQMRNFWMIPVTPRKEKRFGKHPSQKPLVLMERMVLSATKPTDLVLDCFCGSGSTLVAAMANGRSFIGIEKSREYCDIAVNRVRAHEDELTNSNIRLSRGQTPAKPSK